jgi:NAD(P)-dependent dehydrogenase (short-subunit alcohol dehydrogenase family)
VDGATCDVTDAVALDDAVSDFAARHGAVNHLVSNAGAFFAGTAIDTLDLDTWERSLRLNLTSHVLVLQSFLRHAVDDRTGSIVVIGTRNVAAPGPGAAAYSVPKAALAQLVRIAARSSSARAVFGSTW